MEQKFSKHFKITSYDAYLDSLSIATRTLRFLCSIQNNNNVLVSACWKYGSNNANSPVGYNIAYFRNNYSSDILPDVCPKKVIRPP